MVDNRIETVDGLKHQEDTWKPYHDVAATQEHIQNLLAGGIPDWVKHPEDWREYAKESFAAEKEISDTMASEYRFDDQDSLTNRAARMVNKIGTRDFIMKLRVNGIKCFTVDNGFPQTVGLWCLPPKQMQRARYICFLQTPCMYEWSVLKLDAHKLPIGEDFRGWRTVLIQLIEKEILTEYQAHEIFGYPSGNPIFKRYHQSLWELRNHRRYTENELREGDI
jgi:hypothetical protein